MAINNAQLAHKYEIYKNEDGTRYFAKLVEGECVFFLTVRDVEKAHELFQRISGEGYDPATDGRRHSEPDPADKYEDIVAQTKEKPASVCYYRFIECYR